MGMRVPPPAAAIPPDVFVLAGQASDSAWLADDEARHCARVLRHRPGDVIGAIDGRGLYFEGPITEVSKSEVRFEVHRSVADWGEPPRRTTLILPPLAQRDRLEWLVEKAVELGLTRLVFARTARGEPARAPVARLERLMLAALKQSQRSRLPELIDERPWAEALALAEGYRAIGAIGVAKGLPAIATELAQAPAVTWAIGPPADLTAEEVEQASIAGFEPVHLGQTRLRTETAALYALAATKAAAGI